MCKNCANLMYISQILNFNEEHSNMSEAVVQRCSVKKMLLGVSQNSQENTCPRVSFFNKVAGLSPATLSKKRPWHMCFPANFAKFLRTSFFIDHRW